MAQQPKPKPTPPRKPLGKAIQHTDAELEQLAQVTPADIEEAGAFWRANAPKRYQGLLDAKEQNSNA